jgi:hypothetical protein
LPRPALAFTEELWKGRILNNRGTKSGECLHGRS